jgi:hypothetical protein
LKSPTTDTFFASGAAILGQLNITLQTFFPLGYSFVIPTGIEVDSADFSLVGFSVVVFVFLIFGS